MKGKFARPLFVLILLSVIATLLLGCAAPAPAPEQPQPTAAKAAEPAKPAAEPTKAPAAATAAPKAEGGVVNRAGVKLPGRRRAAGQAGDALRRNRSRSG